MSGIYMAILNKTAVNLSSQAGLGDLHLVVPESTKDFSRPKNGWLQVKQPNKEPPKKKKKKHHRSKI